MNLEKMKAVAARGSEYQPSELPPEFAAVAAAAITDLDVRDDLRRQPAVDGRRGGRGAKEGDFEQGGPFRMTKRGALYH